MDFKKMTYKKKKQFLLIGSVLFLLFTYNFVISRTVELYTSNKRLSKEVKDGVSAPEKRKNLQHRLDGFNNSLNKYFADSLKNREYILGVVSEFCNKNHLVLREYPESRLTKEKDFEIETNVVVAEGDFLNLLRLVYELEQKVKIARPASVNFEKKFDHKRRKDVLSVTIYLQNLRVIKSAVVSYEDTTAKAG